MHFMKNEAIYHVQLQKRNSRISFLKQPSLSNILDFSLVLSPFFIPLVVQGFSNVYEMQD